MNKKWCIPPGELPGVGGRGGVGPAHTEKQVKAVCLRYLIGIRYPGKPVFVSL